jgi:uncharacterized iron-regulated membrane protein
LHNGVGSLDLSRQIGNNVGSVKLDSRRRRNGERSRGRHHRVVAIMSVMMVLIMATVTMAVTTMMMRKASQLCPSARRDGSASQGFL